MPYQRKRATKETFDRDFTRKKYWALAWFVVIFLTICTFVVVTMLVILPQFTEERNKDFNRRVWETEQQGFNRSYPSENHTAEVNSTHTLWFIPDGRNCSQNRSTEDCGQGIIRQFSTSNFFRCGMLPCKQLGRGTEVSCNNNLFETLPS